MLFTFHLIFVYVNDEICIKTTMATIIDIIIDIIRNND